MGTLPSPYLPRLTIRHILRRTRVIFVEAMTWIREALIAFGGLAVETIKLKWTSVVCRLLTLFMAVEWRNDLFDVIDPVFPLVDFLEAVLAKDLLILDTIPISFIDVTLLTLLKLRIPLPDPRRRLVGIQIPVVNFIFPNVLVSRLEEVLMVINGHLLFYGRDVY